MNWDDFLKSLRSRGPASVYLLKGDDPYIFGQAIGKLRGHFFKDATGDVVRFRAPEEVHEAVGALRTFPVFSPHRLVIVEPAEEIDNSHRKSLEAYLSSPASFSTLVLVAPGNSRKKVPPWASKKAQELDLSIERPQIQRWIQKWFTEHRIKVGPGVVDLLTERAGGKFGSIVSDLEKLELAIPDGTTVTREDVERFGIDHSEEVIWGILDAIRSNRRDLAYARMIALLGQGEEPLPAIGMLARAMKLRWALSLPGSAQIPTKEIADSLGYTFAWVNAARNKREFIDPASARKAWKALSRADRRLKSSHYSEELVLLDAIEKMM